MKPLYLSATILLLSLKSISQTNTFPSTGNVGIGTTNPQYRLHILSNTIGIDSSRLRLENVGGHQILQVIGKNSGGMASTVHIASGSLFETGIDTDGKFKIAGSNGDVNMLYDNTRLTIDPVTGNIGIGTSAPPEKLSVDGRILAKKIKVSQTGWPDYVFHPSYSLPSLTQIESYIKQNYHLPGIPSAKTVEEKGLDLGDNQAALLKKIEELTLYLIDQNKKIEQMNEDIRKQQEQIKALQQKNN